MGSDAMETGKSFIAELARGAIAENLSPKQRRSIHIETNLDAFLDRAIESRKQVILTGNPGDGKTQHIYMAKDRYPKSEGYYYLLDASEYSPYTELLEEWQAAYEAGKPGILAINDGPLYEMTTQHRDDYPFLETIQQQLEHQLVYDDDSLPSIDFSDFVVIDLNNRNVLTPPIIEETIDQFATKFAKRGHNHTGTCHVQYNARRIGESDVVRENLIELLLTAGRVGEHVTVRDLLNFLCYLLTGGQETCETEFSDHLKYYNLAFTGEGLLFDIFREHFEPHTLTHPFVDSKLWAQAEEAVDPRDTEDAYEEIEAAFLERKRRFLFEDASMEEIEYESRPLYRNLNHEFNNFLNRDLTAEGPKETLLRRINGYFIADSSNRSKLRLWLSHRYRSKSSLALVSRTQVQKRQLTLRKPRLHPEITDPISYNPNHFVLEYTEASNPLRLRFDSTLFERLRALDSSVPYTLRTQDEEQQLLEFMEEVEFHEDYSAKEGEIVVKDTETGRIARFDVNDDSYRI